MRTAKYIVKNTKTCYKIRAKNAQSQNTGLFMDRTEKTLARIIFKSKVSTLTGMAFQNFFTNIMTYYSTDFTPVKPQGSEGDWKNDGHEPQLGRYYQVYAPEVLDETKAVSKIAEDFDGLLLKWGNNKVYPTGIKEFYFVINDAYRIQLGAFPTTLAKLEEIRKKHQLSVCKPFLSKDLEDKLLSLNDDEICTIIGFLPNPADIKILNLCLIDEVIQHIAENPNKRSLLQTLANPTFQAKMSFNNLHATSSWLTSASYRTGTLENYFSANSNFTRQEIRDKLKAIYEASKEINFPCYGTDEATESDHRLVYILNEITPKLLKHDARLEKELQDAALVVMSFFFETCDIFEEPTCANA